MGPPGQRHATAGDGSTFWGWLAAVLAAAAPKHILELTKEVQSHSGFVLSNKTPPPAGKVVLTEMDSAESSTDSHGRQQIDATA